MIEHLDASAGRLMAWVRRLALVPAAPGATELGHSLQLVSCVQNASMPAEWTVYAFLHDVGKAITPVVRSESSQFPNHGAVGAALVQGLVPGDISEMLHWHEAFTNRRLLRAEMGLDPAVAVLGRSWATDLATVCAWEDGCFGDDDLIDIGRLAAMIGGSIDEVCGGSLRGETVAQELVELWGQRA